MKYPKLIKSSQTGTSPSTVVNCLITCVNLIVLPVLFFTINVSASDVPLFPANDVNLTYPAEVLEKGFGVVLLSGPNLDDAKRQAKKFSEEGYTVRVVRDDRSKKNRFRVVSGLFVSRTDAEFHKKELQKELKIKKLWVMEFTGNSKVVATFPAKKVNKPKPPKEKDEEKPTPPPVKDDPAKNKPQENEEEVSSEVSSLINTWNAIMIVYNIGDLHALNEYIHPKIGFTVMQNSGAYVKLDWYNKIDSILYHPLMKVVPKSNQPRFEEAPVYRCELESWSKTGCFIANIDPASKEFSKFERKKNGDWGDNPITIEKIKNCEKLTTRSVFQSENPPYYHKYHIYLAFIDGRWYITGIDLVIPCSA